MLISLYALILLYLSTVLLLCVSKIEILFLTLPIEPLIKCFNQNVIDRSIVLDTCQAHIAMLLFGNQQRRLNGLFRAHVICCACFLCCDFVWQKAFVWTRRNCCSGFYVVSHVSYYLSSVNLVTSSTISAANKSAFSSNEPTLRPTSDKASPWFCAFW